MGVLGQKYGTFGSQTAGLRGANMGVSDRKKRAVGCMISPSRLGEAFDSSRTSVRVESKNWKDCDLWEIKKGADSSESTPEQP